ncbi:hypothetical protein LEN26_011362 [Aphanomyces euteiches]|nr:hypothetical protein LEN26_011362 [Aphanomyces euteiches]KAH9126082.1 hypothetical protein AeMF1_003420 [Aphanomyces euteiches]KAH9189626.1 hypothetical protein AeNC1_008387 [Aphanomyces euteiches]
MAWIPEERSGLDGEARGDTNNVTSIDKTELTHTNSMWVQLRRRAFHHVPVLPKETLELWAPHRNSPDKFYVDGTVGLGGHARLLLEQSSSSTQLLCIDRDPQMLEQAKRGLEAYAGRVHFELGSYKDIKKILPRGGFPAHVDGILVDLGVNSHHLDAGERGFSIYHDGPLDMRFDQSAAIPTAADLVNSLSEVELIKIFTRYGDEPLGKEYAKAIIRRREATAIERTDELKRCVEAIADKWKKKKQGSGKSIHPATRVFQALRIAVNHELDHLEMALPAFIDSLAVDGQLATIAFHSLEDRWIKRFFRDAIDEEDEPEFALVQRKAIQATDEQNQVNPRGRSAKLRAIRRIRHQ